MGVLRLLMEVCLSTQFGHAGDGYGGTTPTIYYQRPVAPGDMGIAHREFPIGSTVKITNLRTGLHAKALVIDRGPYGKKDAKGEWFNGQREKKRKGRYLGCADLTPSLASTIGHNGKDRVRIIWIKDGRKRHEHKRHRKRRLQQRRQQRLSPQRGRNT